MQLERLALRLRPRTSFEAIDLGAAMLRQWWQPVMRVWFAVYVPVLSLLTLVFQDRLWIAVAIAWWLKPLFDRFVLHVLSRAAFGDTPSVRQTLADWRVILSPGLPAALSLSRLDPARSFNLAIWQLEQQRGRAARQRARVLGRKARGYASVLLLAALHFEAVLWLSITLLAGLLAPASSQQAEWDFFGFLSGNFRGAFDPLDMLFYGLAVSVIEPLYVASGFALYLNRRTLLEGWDIELGLRRLAMRLQGAPALLALLLLLTMPIVLFSAAPLAFAQTGSASKSAKEEVAEVLKAPEFGEFKDGYRWEYIGKRREDEPIKPWAGFASIAQLLAELGRIAIYLLAAAALVVVIVYARRLTTRRAITELSDYRPPDALFGWALQPASLPEDVAQVSQQLIEAGHVREGLSLLYRGALSALIHRYRVALSASDTEGEVLRAAAQALPAGASSYLSGLVVAWQATAYAGRLANAASASHLCAGWSEHFSPSAPA